MKKILLLSALFLLIGCKDASTEAKSTIVSPETTKLMPEYPKRVIIFNNPTLEPSDSYFLVYLGSDNHEYQRHRESHIEDQFTHYGGCKLCNKKK